MIRRYVQKQMLCGHLFCAPNFRFIWDWLRLLPIVAKRHVQVSYVRCGAFGVRAYDEGVVLVEKVACWSHFIFRPTAK